MNIPINQIDVSVILTKGKIVVKFGETELTFNRTAAVYVAELIIDAIEKLDK